MRRQSARSYLTGQEARTAQANANPQWQPWPEPADARRAANAAQAVRQAHVEHNTKRVEVADSSGAPFWAARCGLFLDAGNRCPLGGQFGRPTCGDDEFSPICLSRLTPQPGDQIQELAVVTMQQGPGGRFSLSMEPVSPNGPRLFRRLFCEILCEKHNCEHNSSGVAEAAERSESNPERTLSGGRSALILGKNSAASLPPAPTACPDLDDDGGDA